jgi:hypothetical protein
MNTPPQSDWLTASEAAAYLKVKPRSLLLWVHQGKLQAYALLWHEAASMEVPQRGSGLCTLGCSRDTIQAADRALRKGD